MLILIKAPPLKSNVQFEILLLSCLPLIYGKYQTFLTEPFAYRQSMFFAGKNGGDVIFLKHTLGSSLFTMLLLQRLKKGGTWLLSARSWKNGNSLLGSQGLSLSAEFNPFPSKVSKILCSIRRLLLQAAYSRSIQECINTITMAKEEQWNV